MARKAGTSYLGTCKNCGHDKVINGTWGDPPVAKVHCGGCLTYEEFCKCGEEVLTLTVAEALQLEAALGLSPRVIPELLAELRRQR